MGDAFGFLAAAGILDSPLGLGFAWFYEFTPEGLKREKRDQIAAEVESDAPHQDASSTFAIIGVLARRRGAA
jgi:hypothetical protein